jgi:cytochrome c oxidase assembly protein subunit 15
MESIGYSKSIKIWLFTGLVMVFIQVIVGGITRLTESGLSITKWEVISGTLPPLSDQGWEAEFEKYKDTPQYKEINEGMTLSDFKFIYFWEYIHRFWARLMGFVFLFPFLFFWKKGWIDRALMRKMGFVVALAILAAMFGWIMVASGLVDRPWVNAYKLSLHLIIAFSVYAALLWTMLYTLDLRVNATHQHRKSLTRLLWIVSLIFSLQLFFGGVLSGMKAAVVFPTWPDMNGYYLPNVIFNLSGWTAYNFMHYDTNIFMPSLIHFLHRNTAYILFLSGLVLGYKMIVNCDQSKYVRLAGYSLFIVLTTQVLLGIITVKSSVGKVPVLWGVLHQAGALALLTVLVFSFFILRIKK